MALTARAALLTLLGVVPMVAAPGWATLLGWAVFVLALIALDVAVAGSPRALRIEREPLAAVRLGESIDASFSVLNPGRRRVRGLLRDGWEPSAGAQRTRHDLRVRAGGRQALTTALRPTRRGDRRAVHVTVRSLGPLGVAARQATLAAPAQVRVLPGFDSRRHLPSKLARLRELDGRTALRVRGQGTEFDSLREYVDGDDVRSIDWRATARRQEVVVRTWRPERDRRVMLLLDTSRTSAARIGDAPRLDAAMDAALLLAALASRAGDRVDLIAFDRRARARVEGVSGVGLLPALVSAMAPLEPEIIEADWRGIVAAVRGRLSRRALVVLLTPLEGAAIEEGLLPVLDGLTARHQVVVASVADPATALAAAGRGEGYLVYGAAAAERARLDRDAITAELQARGVEVVDAEPQSLPPLLADRYLALKAAGRL